MKSTVSLFIFLIVFVPAFSQADSCNCLYQFDLLTEKLEANYVAWHLNKSKLESKYNAQKSKFRKRAGGTAIQDCTPLLQSFLDFFKDGHLFVVEYPEYSKEELEVFKQYVRTAGLDAADLGLYFSIQKNRLLDIEGIWTDGSAHYAIQKNGKTGKATAFVVNSADKSKIGELKMELQQDKKDAAAYSGHYYSNGYSKRNITAHLYKNNTLLTLSGGIYWKKIGDTSTLAAPMNPALEIIENKFAVITIPSFLVDKKIFDQFLLDNFETLSKLPHWIVDIRGNTGGNGIYFSLVSGYYEKPAINPEPGFAVATKDNLDYFNRFGGIGPYTQVKKAMNDSMGQLVKGPRFNDLVLTPQQTNLQKVVIITDRSNMSAAETFVLYSKAVSSKVITMGDYTGGVVDYNNINIISLGCKSRNIQFGYPMYSRTEDAHINGLNKTGIKPDVFIPKNIADKIAFVVDYLKKN